MAKLEELMTPSELVDAIRDGAAKDELVKKYRASEQQLAMMLLPLYRRGEFTQEEFNNFFKGIPVKREDENLPPDAPDDGSAPTANYYGVMTIPAMFLVGKDGKVISTTVRGDQLYDELEKLLIEYGLAG